MHHRILDLRQFFELILGSAALLLAGAEACATEIISALATHGALAELPPGRLRACLTGQVTEFGSQLPDIPWPSTVGCCDCLQQQSNRRRWEQRACWIDAAVRFTIATCDSAHLLKIQAPILLTLQHARVNSDPAPAFFEKPAGREHRWPQMVLFRSLRVCVEDHTGQACIAEAMQWHHSNGPADYALPEGKITNFEAMLWRYGQAAAAKRLASTKGSWLRHLAKIAANINSGGLGEARAFTRSPTDAHAGSHAGTAKQPAILYLYTGNPDYLCFAFAGEHHTLSQYILPDVIPSTSKLCAHGLRFVRTKPVPMRNTLESCIPCCRLRATVGGATEPLAPGAMPDSGNVVIPRSNVTSRPPCRSTKTEAALLRQLQRRWANAQLRQHPTPCPAHKYRRAVFS